MRVKQPSGVVGMSRPSSASSSATLMYFASSSTLLTYRSRKSEFPVSRRVLMERAIGGALNSENDTYEDSVNSTPDDAGDGAANNDVVRVARLNNAGGSSTNWRNRIAHLLRSFLFSLLMIIQSHFQHQNVKICTNSSYLPTNKTLSIPG